MTKNKEKKTEKDVFAIRMFFVGMIIIVFAPWLMVSWIKPDSFKDTGQIGDTIGGITAPIASLLGSFLVYRALQAQIKANNIIVNQFDEQKEGEVQDRILNNVKDRIKFVRDDIHEFHFGQSKGFQGIDYSLQTWSGRGPANNNNPYTIYIRQIGSILVTIHDTLIYLAQSCLDEGEKKNLKNVIKNTYFKILPYLHREREKLPDDIARIYSAINEELELMDPIDNDVDLWSAMEAT